MVEEFLNLRYALCSMPMRVFKGRRKIVLPLLELKGVSKSFGGLKAVSNVSFALEEGEILGIIGPNGAGKTTLFNTVTGFHEPDEDDKGSY